MKKNHHSLQYKMEANPNKTFKQLKQKQKAKISDWLYKEVFLSASHSLYFFAFVGPGVMMDRFIRLRAKTLSTLKGKPDISRLLLIQKHTNHIWI